MADNFNKGTFGEQGAGFFFGSQGYFLVEGPSGTQEPGHAANAPGFDGVAYNVKTDHLIIYDNKTFKSDRNVGCGTAIDPKVNFGKNLEGLIRRMQRANGIPRQGRILDLLRRTHSAVTCGGVAPPANVQIAITNFGGNSTGVTATLAGRGVTFIDMNRAPAIPARPARVYVNTHTIPGMAKPSSDGLARYNARRGRADAAAAAVTFVAQGLNDLALKHAIEGELARLTDQIANAMASEGGAFVVINIDVFSPSGIVGATTARQLRSGYVISGPTQQQAIFHWENQPRIERAPAPNAKSEVKLFWIERPVIP